MNQTTEQPAKRRNAPATAKPARKSAERAKGMAAERVKATIVMAGSVDFRLSSVAASLGIDRSALAARLIDQGLRAYNLDAVLRQFSDRQSDADGVNLAGNSAA
jgi:hypothetical protein